MLNIRAGWQWRANFPPFTPERRLRIVLISTMPAPQARSCRVTAKSSSSGIRGFSKRALPPPESRKRTVSFSVRFPVSFRTAAVAANEFLSGTGCPASRQSIRGISPFTWPYLVTTTPASIRSPKRSEAALAICQAAFPAAATTSRPPENVFPRRASATA